MSASDIVQGGQFVGLVPTPRCRPRDRGCVPETGQLETWRHDLATNSWQLRTDAREGTAVLPGLSPAVRGSRQGARGAATVHARLHTDRHQHDLSYVACRDSQFDEHLPRPPRGVKVERLAWITTSMGGAQPAWTPEGLVTGAPARAAQLVGSCAHVRSTRPHRLLGLSRSAAGQTPAVGSPGPGPSGATGCRRRLRGWSRAGVRRRPAIR